MSLLKRISGKYWLGCDASVVLGGVEYFEMLEEMIDSAKESIHLHVYIYAPDKTGNSITEALIRASGRGVRVFLLVDSFGSSDMSSNFEKKITQTGIHFRYFMPIFSRRAFHFGRRMHNKVIVIDNKKALVGGINIADKYRGENGQLPWLDFAVAVTGPVCTELSAIYEFVWGNTIKISRIRSGLRIMPTSPYDDLLVAVRDNDWSRGKNAISISYNRAIRNAERSITIVSGYFLPGRRVRHLLKKASKRGVKVKIILGGLSDVGLFRFASRYLYHGLMKSGAEIYEYQKSVLHAKVAVVDGRWSTIGSYNLNYISDFNDLELNIDISGKAFTGGLTETLENIIKDDCVPVTDTTYLEKKSFWLRTRNYWAYQTMRLLMKILNFFTPSNGKYERD